MAKSNAMYANKKLVDKSLCLICGVVGPCKEFVNCHNSTVSATETPLIRFLTNVIGEDPCFRMGSNICARCFLLLDRLDTYQARVHEIFSHLRSRYKDTKLQYMGSRQKLSDQIYSSLSNIKKVKSGTSLKVCNELTVTVFHSGQPPSRPKKERVPSARAKQPVSTISNGIASPKRKLPSIYSNSTVKRPKVESNTTVRKIKIPTKVQSHCKVSSNSNKIQPVITEVKNETDVNSNMKNEPVAKKFQQIESSNSESCDSSSSSDSESSKTIKTVSGRSSSSSNTTKTSSSSSSSNSSSSSSSDSSNGSSSSNSSDSEDETKNTCDVTKNKASENVSKKEQEVNSNSIGTSERSSTQPLEQLDNENLNSQLAEAVLMQNQYANSLLQTFMSTSLWMNDGNNTGKDNRAASSADAVVDITPEALQTAVEAQHCKEKRLELKNTGRSYINTKGKLMEAKRISAQDCSRCPLKCNDRVNEDERKNIFAEYWGLGDYDLQRDYLGNHMKRDKKVGRSGFSRTVVLYFLSKSGNKIQVCRQFFLKTLDVSEKASRIVLTKKVKANVKSQ